MKIFNFTLFNFNSIKNTFKRFPLTLISTTLATIFFFFWFYQLLMNMMKLLIIKWLATV